MSTGRGDPCLKCGKAPLYRFATDMMGRLVEEVLQKCDCAEREAARVALAKERRRLRLCRDCAVSIADLDCRAALCPTCREASNENRYARYRASKPDEIRKRERVYKRKAYRKNKAKGRKRRMDAYYRNHEAEKAKLRARAKASHPQYKERLEQKRELYRRNAEREKARARERYAAKRDEIRAYQNESRALQREIKRRAAEREQRLAA